MTSPPSANPFSSAASPSKKPQPIPWTHEETVNLIQAYQEKWYSLKRGQLKANQWEEVAVTVAARCGYEYNEPSKSAVQCRHKIEKLRRRYRLEKNRLADFGGAVASDWRYFDLMDQLERGPLPISARPLASSMPPPFNYDEDEDEDDEDDGDEEDDTENYRSSRTMDNIVSQRSRKNYERISQFSNEPAAKRRWMLSEEADDDDNADVDYDEVEGTNLVDERRLISGLAAEIKTFAERFIGMENLKMEMMKETERCRLEMENKRIQMIVRSQQRIVDSIGRAFGSSKKLKITEEI